MYLDADMQVNAYDLILLLGFEQMFGRVRVKALLHGQHQYN